MWRGSRSSDAESELAGPRSGQRDQLCDGIDGQRRMHDQQQRRGRDYCDRRKVARRIVADLAVHGRSDRIVGLRTDDQRIAVGLGPGHKFRGDRAARAGPVVNHERLSETLAELLRHDARRNIGAPARREADHDAHRLCRIRRRLRMDGGCAACANDRSEAVREQGLHPYPPAVGLRSAECDALMLIARCRFGDNPVPPGEET